MLSTTAPLPLPGSRRPAEHDGMRTRPFALLNMAAPASGRRANPRAGAAILGKGVKLTSMGGKASHL